MKKREEIIKVLEEMEKENLKDIKKLKKTASVKEYESMVFKEAYDGEELEIWNDAFQKALEENEIVLIPDSGSVYYLNSTVIIPSGRRIEAGKNATIRLTKGTDVLMLRNKNTRDGTHAPITGEKDFNISINGGRWEETRSFREGYGKSGKYDKERSFYGVSTCMLFNNIEGVTLTNMTFSHTAGFAVQMGNCKNIVCKDIVFDDCFADGLHINGNTEKLLIKNISGENEDDLVALNMYDWQDSSVNFGPLKTALVENLRPFGKKYKALRLEPGTYYYDNGDSVDCSANDLIIKDVKGINAFKLYYQTPRYTIGTSPEKGTTGSGKNIYFENISVDLNAPADSFPEYENGDSVRGNFGAFEVGANVENLNFKNIDITLHREKYPRSYLLTVGPKSCVVEGNVEIFDPYVNSSVKGLNFENITVNGKKVSDITPYIKEIGFEDINNDGFSTAKGVFEDIKVK